MDPRDAKQDRHAETAHSRAQTLVPNSGATTARFAEPKDGR